MRLRFNRIGIIFALLITVGAISVSASNAHHCLIGEPITTWKTTDNWSKNYEEFALTSPANTNWDEFCIYIWVKKNQTFAFNNHFFNPGEAKQVGPTSDQATINKDGGTGVGVATDGTTNAWKYTGATGLVKICAAQSSGGSCQGEWKPYVWVEESKEIEILKGNKIMFYFGMTTSWNEDWNVLRTSNTSEKDADQQYHRLPESKCSSWISVAYVSPAQYYVGKTGWAGVQMESTAEAGCLYSVYNDDGDKIYKNVADGAIPHFATTTVNKTVGTVDSEIAATANKSIYGNEQVLYYYYTTDGGTTFTKFDPSDISSLAVGVYTVYALGWDGHILVRSDNTVTLNVGVTISLEANGGTDGDVTSVFATSGIAASTGNIAVASLPTKTGYTFNGFWTLGEIEVINENGEWKTNVSGYTDNSGNWICSAASTLYAHWTPKPYTVGLDNREADPEHGGTASVNVTYDATTGLTSDITLPQKEHYTFGGYFTEVGGVGTQLINADGAWIADVSGYTSASKQWIYAGDITLYAKWDEDLHDVTIAVSPAEAGVVQVSGETISSVSNVGYATHSPEMTAVPANAAWVFKEWRVSDDTKLHLDVRNYSQFGETMEITATDNGQTLTAFFERRYGLIGSLNEEGDPDGGMPNKNGETWGVERSADYEADFEVIGFTALGAGDGTGVDLQCTRYLLANKQYKFQVVDRSTIGRDRFCLAENGSAVLEPGNSVTLTYKEKVNANVLLNTEGEGYYTFKITNISNDGNYYPTLTVIRPQQVNFGQKYQDIDGALYKGTTGGSVVVAKTAGGVLTTGDWVTYNTSVTHTATATSPGYTFAGWWSSDAFEGDAFSNTNPMTYAVTSGDNAYAKFVETSTSVTLANDGHGKVQIGEEDATSTTCGVTTTRELTAVPNEGYKFSSWSKSGDDIELSSTSTNPTTLTGLGAGVSSGQEVRANFIERWIVQPEVGEWGYAYFTIEHIEEVGGKTIGYVDITLKANTNYQFSVVDRDGDVKYKNGFDQVYYMTNGNSHNWGFATDKSFYCGITTAGAGVYRFTWNITDKKMTVTYPNFVIYRTGDKADDPRAQNTDVESYDGGTISQAIEFRMRVNRLDQWYTLCLPFTVTAVKVWDEEDGQYYDIVPYYRTGDKYYTGHYIIRTPVSTTDFAIENFDSRDRWVDPSSAVGYLPSANTPYIIQWHTDGDNYFLNKYISFFGTAGQIIPTAMDKGSYASSDETVNIYGNNSMTTGTVRDAYLLDPYYGPDGAWMREEIGTDRSVLPFECFILANPTTTAKYRVLRRDMADDTPTGLDTLSKTEDTVSKVLINNRIYIIRGGKMYTIQGTFVKEVE